MSSNAPMESASDLWLERANFSGAILGGVTYGIHASVYVATMYHLIHRSTRTKSTSRRLSMIFITAVFLLGTLQVACMTRYFEMMWIDDRNAPGGPVEWQLQNFDTPVNTVSHAGYVCANFLTDGLLLHRLLMIWKDKYIVLVIPVLAFLGSTALSILTLFQSAQPGANLWTHTTIVFAVPYWSLTIALNATMTLLIALRILWMRRGVMEVLGKEHAKPYTSIASMVIESGALYSGIGIVFISCYARNTNVQFLVYFILSQAMCIAPQLIVLRVALGTAWSRETSHLSISANMSAAHRGSLQWRRTEVEREHTTNVETGINVVTIPGMQVSEQTDASTERSGSKESLGAKFYAERAGDGKLKSEEV